jgi:D-alanyl-D-alanine dipeptidase
MTLVKICPQNGLEIQLAYATVENFMGEVIYQKPLCFLHKDAATLLETARLLACQQGLGLKILDAFRPSEAQWKLWKHTPDPAYVADPRQGSPHGRGIAVDLTLFDQETGKELEMGTSFDDLSPKSHHGDTKISETAQKNRYLLLGIMMSAGWDLYINEWWHYQLFNPRTYPLLCDKEAPESMMESNGRAHGSDLIVIPIGGQLRGRSVRSPQ